VYTCEIEFHCLLSSTDAVEYAAQYLLKTTKDGGKPDTQCDLRRVVW